MKIGKNRKRACNNYFFESSFHMHVCNIENPVLLDNVAHTCLSSSEWLEWFAKGNVKSDLTHTQS